MCSGEVTVTITGVNVDAAVKPILTLFSGSNSTGNGMSDDILRNNELRYCIDALTTYILTYIIV